MKNNQPYTMANFYKATKGAAVSAEEEIAKATPVAARTAHAKKAGYLILILCLALAVLVSLLVPVLVGGVSPAIASETAMAVSSATPRSVTNCTTWEAAEAALGYMPVLPAAWPADASVTSIDVVDGTILEVAYVVGKGSYIYRTAEGSDDLSASAKTYAFTTTETVDEISRTYSGVTDKVFTQAVWAANGYSYAILAENGVEADQMRVLAESIV